MAQVYDISVRFMRRVQIREYEPSEVEVILKAQLSEDDDSATVGGELMAEAKETVRLGLTAKGGKTEAKVEVEKKAEPKKETAAEKKLAKKAATKKAADEKKAAKGRAISDDPENRVSDEDAVPDDDEIPGDEPPAKKAKESNDVPDDDDDEALKPKDLQEYIQAKIQKRVITIEAVKEIIRDAGVNKVKDMTPAQCAETKKKIDDLIEAGDL
jgi:hypothetical protein